MKVYKRKINRRLLSFRLTFLVLVSSCLLAFNYNVDSLAVLFLFILFILSVMVIEDLSISNHSFELTKYYFFGLVRKKKRFEKNRIINTKPIGDDFGDYGETIVDDSHSTGIGCLFSLFFFMFPPKVVKREFYLEMISSDNSSKEKAYLSLTNQEFEYLKEILYKQQCT